MKRILATILCLTIIMSLGASIGLAKEFPDVDASHWAYKYIDELSNNGVINGYDDGSFNPQGTITRAEFIKLIVSTSPDVLKLTESIIEDESIETKNWYDKYYAAAGIVMNALPREYSDEELNKPITRVEMAYIVDQFCEYRGLYEEEENYDVLVNQEEYNQAIRKYAKENNLITDDKLTDDEFNNAFLDLSDEQREKVVKDVTENIDLQTIPIDELIEGFEYLKQAMIEKGFSFENLLKYNFRFCMRLNL